MFHNYRKYSTYPRTKSSLLPFPCPGSMRLRLCHTVYI